MGFARKSAILSILAAFAAGCGGGGPPDNLGNMGSACQISAQCANGLVCYRTGQSAKKPDSLPGGYCSHGCLDGQYCKSDADCYPKPLGGGCDTATGTCRDCAGTGQNSGSCVMGMCMSKCLTDSDCGRAGYVCSPEFGTCVAMFASLGRSCAVASDCGNGMACMTDLKDYPPGPVDKSGKPYPMSPYTNPFQRGYCTYACGSALDCPQWGGLDCASPVGGSDKYCLFGCKADQECYSLGQTSCRLVTVDPDMWGGRTWTTCCAGADNIGATCTQDGGCFGSALIDGGTVAPVCTPASKTKFYDNICSTACTADFDCPYDTLCAPGGFCVRKCYLDDNCVHGGYACRFKGYRSTPYNYDTLMWCSGVNNLGAACDVDAECTSGFACRKGDLYPGGFCSPSCTADADCAKYGMKTCADLSGATSGPDRFCQRDCADTYGDYRDFICARGNYSCIAAVQGGAFYCATPAGNTGAACEYATDCPSGRTCMAGRAWPDGYCSRFCQADQDCGQGSGVFCLSSRDVYGNGVCVRSCSADKECGRAINRCMTDTGDSKKRKYCTPTPEFGAKCTPGNPDLIRPDCNPALSCLTVAADNPVCTRPCAANADCMLSDVVCAGDPVKYCWRKCTADADCINDSLVCNTREGRCAPKG